LKSECSPAHSKANPIHRSPCVAISLENKARIKVNINNRQSKDE